MIFWQNVHRKTAKNFSESLCKKSYLLENILIENFWVQITSDNADMIRPVSCFGKGVVLEFTEESLNSRVIGF